MVTVERFDFVFQPSDSPMQTLHVKTHVRSIPRVDDLYFLFLFGFYSNSSYSFTSTKPLIPVTFMAVLS